MLRRPLAERSMESGLLPGPPLIRHAPVICRPERHDDSRRIIRVRGQERTAGSGHKGQLAVTRRCWDGLRQLPEHCHALGGTWARSRYCSRSLRPRASSPGVSKSRTRTTPTPCSASLPSRRPRDIARRGRTRLGSARACYMLLTASQETEAHIVTGFATGRTLKDLDIEQPCYFRDPKFRMLVQAGLRGDGEWQTRKEGP